MLLTDLHIHSTFSDGRYSIPDVIDIYGKAGFDAIAITDHLAEENSIIGNITGKLRLTITRNNFRHYMDVIREQGERAKHQYGMLVIPGFEITKNHFLPFDSSHIVALDVEEYISADDDAKTVLENIRNSGGFSIAAHPLFTRRLEWQTLCLWHRRNEIRHLVDAWEAGNGCFLSSRLVRSGLPVMANSDFHSLHQLTSWKTLIDAKRNTADILDAVRKQKINFIFYNAGIRIPLRVFSSAEMPASALSVS